jgi:hypothetical protein
MGQVNCRNITAAAIRLSLNFYFHANTLSGCLSPANPNCDIHVIRLYTRYIKNIDTGHLLAITLLFIRPVDALG